MPPAASLLIVDDQLNSIKVVVNLLRATYRIQVAATGADALRLLDTAAAPDLILLDIVMPDMDGYQLCAHLKAMARTRDTPVVFLSAKSEASDEARGFAAGALDYLTKPVQPERLQARVKAQLGLAQQLKYTRRMLTSCHRWVARCALERDNCDEALARLIRRASTAAPGLDERWPRETLPDDPHALVDQFALMPRAIDVLRVWRQLVAIARRAAAAKRILLRVSLDGARPEAREQCPVLADSGLLFALLHRLLNALIDAAPTGARLDLELERDRRVLPRPGGGAAEAAVHAYFLTPVASGAARSELLRGLADAGRLAALLGFDVHIEAAASAGDYAVWLRMPASR